MEQQIGKIDLRLRPASISFDIQDNQNDRVQKLCTSLYNQSSHWIVKHAAHAWLADDNFAYLDAVVAEGDDYHSSKSSDSSETKERLESVDAVKARLKNDLLNWLKTSDVGFQLRNHIHTTHKRLQREFDRQVCATNLSLNHQLADDTPSGFLKTVYPTGMHVELPRVGYGVEEPLLVIDTARKQWDARLRFELRSVASRQKRPLRCVRNDFLGKVSSSAEQRAALLDDENAARFVYTSEDLLDTLTAITNPNNSTTGASFNNKPGHSQSLDLVHVMLSTPSMQELRITFRELRPEFCQIGVDEDVNTDFLMEKMTIGRELAKSAASVPLVQQYAKTGVPASLRPSLWQIMSGASRDAARYEKLFQMVTEWDFITDDLVRYDVQHAIDSDEFFVFADTLEEIMLVFSRDDSIAKDCAFTPNSAVLLSAPLPSSSGQDQRGPHGIDSYAVPPCTIVPFYQQTMLAAPICFLYREPSACYALFKSLFCQYFCRLHIISSRRGGILYLAKLFERLVQSQHPSVVFHCCRYGISPLRVTFPWMFTAFAGFLPVQEVLKLWDRVLAYESLDLIAILAAAIFCYRAPSVLKCSSAEDIEAVFRELNTLHAIPLLQDFLFSTDGVD